MVAAAALSVRNDGHNNITILKHCNIVVITGAGAVITGAGPAVVVAAALSVRNDSTAEPLDSRPPSVSPLEVLRSLSTALSRALSVSLSLSPNPEP